MAAPVIASSSSNKAGECLTDITVTYAVDGPSGITSGDLLMAFITMTGAGTTPNIPLPTGWTQLARLLGTTGSRRLGAAVFYKEAGASETAETFTATPDTATNGMTVKVARITGWDALAVLPTLISTTPSDPFALTGITTTVDESLVLFMAASAATAVRTVTFSLGTEQWDFGSDPGEAASQAVSSLVKSPAGATGDESADWNTAPSAACGFAIAIAPPVVTEGNPSHLLLRGVS